MTNQRHQIKCNAIAFQSLGIIREIIKNLVALCFTQQAGEMLAQILS